MNEEGRPEIEENNVTQEKMPQKSETAPAQPSARVAPSLKPGLFARLWDRCRAMCARIPLPVWDLRLFTWLLIGIVAIIFLASNWAPMRFYFFGVHCELPRSVAMLVLLGLGFLAGWFARAPRNESEA